MEGLDQEVQHVPALQIAGGADGQEAFDESIALLAVRAEAGLAPPHGRPNGALRSVVGRLDARNVGKGPQGAGHFEDALASALRLGVAAPSPFFEQGLDPLAQGRQGLLEFRASQEAVAEGVPEFEEARVASRSWVPMAAEAPTRSAILVKSRLRWDQQSWRRAALSPL